MPVKRTEYFNFDTGTVRTGATVHGESMMDTEDYFRRLDEARGSTLHTWGVSGGLGVSATPGQAGLTVQVGTALDVAGRLSVLEAGGFAVVDPSVDPDQLLNIPIVVVGAEGLNLSTTGVAAGTHLLTLTWREVLGETRLIRLHAPWLRLVPSTGFDDVGRQVVLAEVSVGADGSVSALAPGPRRAVGVPVERVELRSARVATGSATSVGQGTAAELRARRDGGGLDLLVFSPDGTGRTALSAHGATGRVSIGTSGASDTHGLRISSPTAGSGIELVNDDTGPAYGMFPGDDGSWHLRNEDDETDLVVVDREGAMGITGRVDVSDSLGVEGDVIVSGSVGIAIDDSVNASLQVDGSGVHSGGQAGGFSFADRAFGGFVEQPQSGERWLWYAFDGKARLWSGEDLVSIGHGPGNALDVRRRMRVREGPEDTSAGIWFHQRIPDADHAFVGMENDTSVGFWGNTGGQWGLVMDTSSGFVSCRNGLSLAGDAHLQNNLRVQGAAIIAGDVFTGDHFGRQDGPAQAVLFGSRVGDTGEGILFLRSGGNVVAFDGTDFVGIGTRTPQFKLDVNGEIRARGAIHQPASGFMIDHPLDPGNKYLRHSFVESPEMATFYDGVIETDERGEATVVLPDYFEALNRDFHYQLTPVGTVAQAAVISEIRDNTFTLRTDKPGVKVSWQVTGVRQDAWAEAHRLVSEEEKVGDERERYLHPEEHGQPKSLGLVQDTEGTDDGQLPEVRPARPDAGASR
ncbi:hypothetical protein MTF65_03905 [Streptomyces sp. APSN-46.1]|uniref:hypothetical protein n=1 Tax=Streptomyces sp. APSN-46.1 TaxID=2929049 RepID=UPI001FB38251|nr:hypothetical protein [Streptomyces sp. APSN-46.1]MCJ1676508.1 hypothetical protein [Streptomyces sp. APSN-46.1]